MDEIFWVEMWRMSGGVCGNGLEGVSKGQQNTTIKTTTTISRTIAGKDLFFLKKEPKTVALRGFN
jgi:hypothetical protein